MTVDKAKRNRQNAPSRARYEAKAYRKYTIRARTDGADGFTPEQMEKAAKDAGKSVNAWIVDAIRNSLEQHTLAFPQELGSAIRSAADAAGMSVNDWIFDIIQRELYG